MNQIYSYLYKILKKTLGKRAAELTIDWLAEKTTKPQTQEKHGILILRLDVIGDFIIWCDAAKEYRNLFPDEHITIIGGKRWASFAKQLPYWDDVWEFDTGKFSDDPQYRYRLMKKIIKANFKTVIQATHIRFFHGDAMVRISRAESRIGSIGDPKHKRRFQKQHSDKWYTKLIPAAEPPLMMLIREAEFMRGLGAHDYRAKVANLTPYLRQPANPFSLPLRYGVLCPGAGGVYKRWPIDKFTMLATRTHELTALPWVICGGETEQNLAKEVAEVSKVPCINLTGQTSLNDLAWIIHHAAFIVTNDTGAVHIAAAVGTPSVCLLGGGQYGRCLPYKVESGSTHLFPKVCIHQMDCFGCNWKNPCLTPEEKKSEKCVPCIAQISVDEVFNEIKKTWQSPKN